MGQDLTVSGDLTTGLPTSITGTQSAGSTQREHWRVREGGLQSDYRRRRRDARETQGAAGTRTPSASAAAAGSEGAGTPVI